MYQMIVAFLLAASAALAQYKVEPAGAPPSDVPAPFAQVLSKDGAKVVSSNGSVVCEMWLRSSVPNGPPSTEEGINIPTIPHGAFLGVLRIPAKGEDRRGQNLKAGTYTLRYSLHPVNGDHLGVAPQRDFLVLVPAADDKDVNATPNFDDLMVLSRKASGTPHPAVLSMSKSGNGKFPELTKEGDHDWVLHLKAGDLPLAVIVIGRAEG